MNSANSACMAPQDELGGKNVPDRNDSIEEAVNDSLTQDEDFVIVYSSDDGETSSDDGTANEHENTSSGYRLLTQDDPGFCPAGYTIDSEDEDETNDAAGAVAASVHTRSAGAVTSDDADAIPSNLDIDYADLRVSGIDEPGPSSTFQACFENQGDDLIADSATSDVNSIQMSEEQAALVKNAMCGFVLPAVNIPEWAKDMTDEQWKASYSSVSEKRKK